MYIIVYSKGQMLGEPTSKYCKSKRCSINCTTGPVVTPVREENGIKYRYIVQVTYGYRVATGAVDSKLRTLRRSSSNRFL